MTIRLLIADDHPIVRSGLKAILASQPDFELVAEAHNGADAVNLATAHTPDVIMIDLQMPQMDGLAAIQQILKSQTQAHILVLTTYQTDADILPALEAGATGYLLKDAPPEELFHAIRAASRGEKVLSPSITARMMERLSSPAEKALSRREIEVLELAAHGASNREIAEKLHITEATAKSHFVHIFEKLNVTDRTAAVTAALEKKIIRLD